MFRIPRRFAIYILVILVITTLYLTHRSSYSWRDLPLESIGLGDDTLEEKDRPPVAILEELDSGYENITKIQPDGKKNYGHSNIVFTPGQVKPAGHNYTKALVIPKMTREDISWIKQHFPDGSGFDTKVYVVDDPTAPLHPPKNKGNEVMIYLSYIIDHYEDELSDVNIFIHSHQTAWHNNELFEGDSATMISRLSAERVQREGFMNLRCSWDPGCPSWMHPGTAKEDPNKQEEVELARTWSELFPLDPVPPVLAQPCCAQFAVSADRIRTLPKARYVFYRDWLLRTRFSNFISGRVWEYLWQYVFTGRAIVCPETHVCYCDGYGLCFGGKKEFDEWMDRKHDRAHFQEELIQTRKLDAQLDRATEDGKIDESKEMAIPEFGKIEKLEKTVQELDEWIKAKKAEAFERGENPQNRALEAGRGWVEGMGF